MAIYSAAQRTSTFTINVGCWELRTTATDRPRVMEMGFFSATATVQTIGIGRPAAIGITPAGGVTVQAEDPGDPAGTVVTALSWATPPTAPTVFLRRYPLAAVVGVGFIATFPNGLVIPISYGLVFNNITVSVASDVHVVLDE